MPPAKQRRSKAAMRERERLKQLLEDSDASDDDSIDDDIGAAVLSQRAVTVGATGSAGVTGNAVSRGNGNAAAAAAAASRRNDNSNDNPSNSDSSAASSPHSPTTCNSTTSTTNEECTTTNNNGNTNRNDNATAEEESALEQKARKRITASEDRFLDHWTKAISFDTDQLRWHLEYKKRGRKAVMSKAFPCRVCHPDEGKLLDLSSSSETTGKSQKKNAVTLIQYLGGKMTGAAQLMQVPSRQLVPLVDLTTGTILQEHMATFLNCIRHQKAYKTDHNTKNAGALNLLIEKCTLEAIVEKCQQVKKDSLLQGKAKAASSDNTTSEKASADKASHKGGAEMPPSNLESGQENDNEDDNEDDDDDKDDAFSWDDQDQDPQTTTTTTNASTNTASSGGLRRVPSFDPDKKEKRQRIMAGCIIQYDQPNTVAGSDLRTARVLRVTNHKDEDFVLHLESGQMLQREDRVKLLLKIHRNKLVPNDDDSKRFQTISAYYLQNSTTTRGENGGDDNQEWVGMKLVGKIKDAFQDHADAVAANPNTAFLSDIVRGVPSKRESKMRCASTEDAPPAEQPKKTKHRRTPLGKARKQTPISDEEERGSTKSSAKTVVAVTSSQLGTKKDDITTISERWWNLTSNEHLARRSEAITIAVPRSVRRARKVHHMSPEQLNLAIQVRVCLETLVKKSSGTQSLGGILSDIVAIAPREEQGFSLSQLKLFLAGDSQKQIPSRDVSNITLGLTTWLDKTGYQQVHEQVEQPSTDRSTKDLSDNGKVSSEQDAKPAARTTSMKRRASLALTETTNAPSAVVPSQVNKSRRMTISSGASRSTAAVQPKSKTRTPRMQKPTADLLKHLSPVVPLL